MEPLVTVDWLTEHLDDPQVAILEVSSARSDAAPYYTAGHIPGSRFAWWKDLCWDATDREFPAPAVLADRLRAFGISDDTSLVLVGDPVQFATYTFWVLALTGLDHVATILDGGRQLWDRRQLPLTRDEPQALPAGNVTPAQSSGPWRVGREDVLAHLADPGRVLVDMRTLEEHTGERVSPRTSPFDHGAERNGRIPGARHLYFERLLSDDGTFLAADQIREQFSTVGADPRADVVTYCRLSHRATLGWFAATRLAGWENVRVYDGSWTEWGSIVGYPIERSTPAPPTDPVPGTLDTPGGSPSHSL